MKNNQTELTKDFTVENLEDELREQGVREDLLRQVQQWRNRQSVSTLRVRPPRFLFIGKDVWEEAISALLSGEHILLVGAKATGKNVLADNLAWLFQQPSWNISFHVNTDASTLIGTDTFSNGEVQLRKGPVAQCAEQGGIGILDEINMAKNDAIAVLHAALDYRRLIDIPGYDRIDLHPATRFIATMNYGYVGTRELNEALASRFLVIQMPTLSTDNLKKLIRREFPSLADTYVEEMAGLFHDLQVKSENAEISTKPVDLRGLLSALGLISTGLSPTESLEMGIGNKSFDAFERRLVLDVIRLHVPKQVTAVDFFPELEHQD